MRGATVATYLVSLRHTALEAIKFQKHRLHEGLAGIRQDLGNGRCQARGLRFQHRGTTRLGSLLEGAEDFKKRLGRPLVNTLTHASFHFQ